MGSRNKGMRAVDLLTQVLGLAAELLTTVRKRTKEIRNTAYDKVEDARKEVEDARKEAAVVAERLAKSAQGQLHPAPSTGMSVLKFAAGFSLGVGAGILLAPMSGKRMREKLPDAARGGVASSKSVVDGRQNLPIAPNVSS
jgi:gas vesicle protein